MATFGTLFDKTMLTQIDFNTEEKQITKTEIVEEVQEPILEFQGAFRWLSNFAECKINFNGYVFNSVEHAYQAAKCARHEDIIKFVDIEPGHAKRLGRKIIVRSDWENVKIPIMRELLVQKFLLNYHYGDMLLFTGNRHIQEGNRWNDKFWGVCLKTNKGENNLGRLIMELRTELQKME